MANQIAIGMFVCSCSCGGMGGFPLSQKLWNYVQQAQKKGHSGETIGAELRRRLPADVQAKINEWIQRHEAAGGKVATFAAKPSEKNQPGSEKTPSGARPRSLS